MTSLVLPILSNTTKNHGFLLLELMVVLAIMASLLAASGPYLRSLDDQLSARGVGNQLRQYNHAVRAFIADQGLATPASTNTGVNWLKDAATCPGGTAAKAYLACWFSAGLPFDLTYSTVITNNGTIVEGTTSLGPITAHGQARTDLSGLVARIAMGGDGNFAAPADATFYNFSVNSTTSAIEALATTAPALDAWLRRDGSVTPTADLSFNGFAITDASDVTLQTGQTLGAATTVQTALLPGETVSLPSCPTGLTPQAHCSNTAVFSPSGKAITGYQCRLTPNGAGWTFNPVVATENGNETIAPTDPVVASISIKCG